MPAYTPLGQPETVGVTFLTNPADPTSVVDPTTVNLAWLPCGSSVWQTATVSSPWAGSVITRSSVGVFAAPLSTTVDGFWRYEFTGLDVTGATIGRRAGYFWVARSARVALVAPTLGPNGYPYPYGYADVNHVTDRVSGGAWDPSLGSAAPTVEMVEGYLLEATAEVDLVLRKTGYYIPLTMQASYPPSPLPLTVLTRLQVVTATLAVATVEKVRHGSATQESDQVGADWQKRADGLLSRLGDGSDNFWQLGIDGDFPPQPNQSRGAAWTGQSDASGNPNVPLFSRNQSF